MNRTLLLAFLGITMSRDCKKERYEMKKEKVKAALEDMQAEMERLKPEVLAECNAKPEVMDGGENCTCEMSEDKPWKKAFDCMLEIMGEEMNTCSALPHFIEETHNFVRLSHREHGCDRDEDRKHGYGGKGGHHYEMQRHRHKRMAEMEDAMEEGMDPESIKDSIVCEKEGENTKDNFVQCCLETMKEKMAAFKEAKHAEKEAEEEAVPMEERMAEENKCNNIVPPECRNQIGHMRYEVCDCVNNIVQKVDEIKRRASICIPKERKKDSCKLMEKFAQKIKMSLFKMSDICESNKVQKYHEERQKLKMMVQYKRKGKDKEGVLEQAIEYILQEKPDIIKFIFEKLEKEERWMEWLIKILKKIIEWIEPHKRGGKKDGDDDDDKKGCNNKDGNKKDDHKKDGKGKDLKKKVEYVKLALAYIKEKKPELAQNCYELWKEAGGEGTKEDMIVWLSKEKYDVIEKFIEDMMEEPEKNKGDGKKGDLKNIDEESAKAKKAEIMEKIKEKLETTPQPK